MDDDDDLITSRPDALVECAEDGMNLQYCTPPLLADRALVFISVNQNGDSLQFATELHRADKAVVLEAVKQDGYALQWASEELRADLDVVREAVRQNGDALKHASAEARKDKPTVMLAVAPPFGDGCALQWVLPEPGGGLRADREIVLQAVRRHGEALQYAVAALQGDGEVVLEACRKGKPLYAALQFAGEAQKDDAGLVTEAVKVNSMALQWASARLQGDHTVVMEAVRGDPSGKVLERGGDPALRGDGAFLEVRLPTRSSGSYVMRGVLTMSPYYGLCFRTHVVRHCSTVAL